MIMPKLTGLSDIIPLTQIKAISLYEILGKRLAGDILENNLSNRILYPSCVSFSAADLEFDLAVLRQAVKANPEKFYNLNLHTIYIPESLLNFYPNLLTIAWIFIESINPKDITQILLKSDKLGLKSIGTVVKPVAKGASGEVQIILEDKKYQVKIGTRMVIPAESNKVDFKFESKEATILGKDSGSLEVSGGKIGLLIDA